MTAPQPLTIFTLAIIISMAYAHVGGGHIPYQELGPRIFCGRSLARVIQMLCIDSQIPEKKSEMYNSILRPYYKDQENQFGWPWIAPHKARSMEMPNRGKRLIVNECCDKPCTINELLSYC